MIGIIYIFLKSSTNSSIICIKFLKFTIFNVSTIAAIIGPNFGITAIESAIIFLI